MAPRPRLLAAALALLASGCSWFWPRVVSTHPADPEVFHSGFPLVAGARTDGAMCSLATVGPEVTLLVRPPAPVGEGFPLGAWCAAGEASSPGELGRAGRLVVLDGKHGRARGYLFPLRDARGLLVAFSGLAASADGWVNARLAQLAARRGLATFAPVRDESARPIAFDPLREARVALGGALAIVDGCGLRERHLAFVGVSMGGMEALLANREAAAEGLATRAAVLDPLLDPTAAAENLDGFWHSFDTDAMQAYFGRILRGRYGEPASTTFGDLLNRTSAGTVTVLARDAPSAWLCKADPAAHVVFLSDGDPVLGDRQASFARACGFPVRRARTKGHVGLACRLELFEELLQAADPPAAGPRPPATSERS